MRLITDFLFLVLFFVLLVAWAMAWLAFHVVSGGVHVLLGIAVLFFILHLLRSGRGHAV